MHKKVYVIVLNYNGWKDTIDCLESLLRSDYLNYQVIVVDNNSINNSIAYIKMWAEGKLDVYVHPNSLLRYLSYPPIQKPIPYTYYTQEEAESGGNVELENTLKSVMFNGVTTKYPLIFIQTKKNLGFAGGNNVGIKYALAKNDFEYIWLLNNDTVIEKNSLSNLVQKFEFYQKNRNKTGIVGSKLLYYDTPKIIQGIGGVYNKYFAVAKQLGVFEEDKGQYDNEKVVGKIDYTIGASMLVSKNFINEVGFMCEDYFLYFEELDWAIRGRKKGFVLGYCWDSRVYHKEGKTIGSSCIGSKKSELADYYGIKNRFVFTKKFFPQCLLTVYLSFFIIIWNRIIRGQFRRVGLILKVIGLNVKNSSQ